MAPKSQRCEPVGVIATEEEADWRAKIVFQAVDNCSSNGRFSRARHRFKPEDVGFGSAAQPFHNQVDDALPSSR